MRHRPVKNKDAIEVNKIVFVNDGFSEKIIRKKIDKKIAYLFFTLGVTLYASASLYSK